jgi:hypothetical protein
MSAKNYQKAIDCYSKAIEIDGSNPIYYGNRYLFFIKTLDLPLLLRLESQMNHWKMRRRR